MDAPALGPAKFDLHQSCFVAYDDHKYYQGKVRTTQHKVF